MLMNIEVFELRNLLFVKV